VRAFLIAMDFGILSGMAKTETVIFDEATATALKKRAEERGVTVSDLVASYLDEDAAPAGIADGQIEELDRRWASVQAGEPTVTHESVVRWLSTWGTPTYAPWRKA
jgi:hypothetical protein